MELSIITLTYNNLEYTQKFIQSLYKYTKDFELIIVDNGSTDGTIEYLKSLSGIKTIFNKENAGYSKGNNQGIKIAEGKYIGFLNNDILLSPDWFEECKKVFEKEKAAFVSPQEINPKFNNTNEKKYLKYFKKEPSYKKTFDDCQFACVITQKDILNKIGSFDENYSPAFWEDNDLKYRAIEAGYDTFVTNNACFFHFRSATSKNFSKNFEKNRTYYYSKNRFAEYLSIYADENTANKLKSRFFEPLNIIYNLNLFIQKVMRNLKRIGK